MRRNCVCGELAVAIVEVHWADGDRRYWYCRECADGILETVDGTEEVPR